MEYRILIVDDEEEMCISLSMFLSSKGYRTLYATDSLKVQDLLLSTHVDLIIMDIKMPRLGGIDLLKNIKERDRSIPIIMITGFPSIENAVLAMKYGALNFYVKPLRLHALLDEISQVLNVQRKRKQGFADEHRMITESQCMAAILMSLTKVAPTDATVLIVGESGTGKELAARYIHQNSDRRDGPFVKVNCAAIPDTLIESEMFGHEKGAFTDAKTSREGKFELANHGTIFLDEIGDMSLTTQPKILRVLQEKRFERLGGNKDFALDVRFITATNKDLSTLIEDGLFREDLYYRISVVIIDLPPLRERKEDILPIAQYFMSFYNQVYGSSIKEISEEVKQIFIQHDWPGNIRELKNCMERAIIFCEGDTIGINDLAAQYKNLMADYEAGDFQDLQNSLSRAVIMEALKKSAGNKKKAARLLNIHRKTLYNRMKKLGIS